MQRPICGSVQGPYTTLLTTGGSLIKQVTSVKDLGITVNHKLSPSDHIREATKKVTQKMKRDVNLLEGAQRALTRRILHKCKVKFTSYPERLKLCKLETLESRRYKALLLYYFSAQNSKSVG